MSDEQSAAAAAFARQRAAMAVEGLTCPEKAVLLVLAIMANADGVAWPSITQLAAKASIGRRTAFEALDRLAALSLIEREPVPGRGARYTIPANWCAPRTSAAAALVRQPHSTSAPPAPKQPENNHKRKKTSSSLSTRAASNFGFSSVAAKPSSAIDLPALPAGASEQQWADYVEMRVAMARADKRRTWTPTIARKAIETLHKLAAKGNDPGAVLDQSVLNIWQGLFPVESNTHGRRGQSVPARGAGIRGSRPDPALDLLYAARAAEEAERAGGDRQDDSGTWIALPPYGGD